ncbi:hypothetical protein LJC08_04300 [Methanimicrococcus sp. OttesenSCG-928-J09]|nr:hypothetical protein [Methanimicrococcus sp. OttesenSCG-928-J09]
MNMYKLTITLGWILVSFALIGTLVSCFLEMLHMIILPVMLLILLLGFVLWWFAVKSEKEMSTQMKGWMNPNVFQKIILWTIAANILFWFVHLAAVYFSDVAGNISSSPAIGNQLIIVYMLGILTTHIIYCVLYLIIAGLIKKEIEKNNASC